MPGYYLIVAILHSRDIVNTAELTISEGYRKLDDDILYVHSRRYARSETTCRCCLHLYYNLTRRARAIDAFNEALFAYRQKVGSGKPVAAEQQAYDKYFIVKTQPRNGGRRSLFNTEAREHHSCRYAGFQALLSGSSKDSVEAMRVCQDKGSVENCFDELKNTLDMKRLRMHTLSSINGRQFIRFISRIPHRYNLAGKSGCIAVL
ncbi:MAG: hypothetical protein JW989_01745 [Chlorobiaceae bacterium]|nr:hypothetical protein [Chlorobiaceae bacterium]